MEAKMLTDSVNVYGHRARTFRLRYPKFIHSEFMTHRVLSRNASSSRAVPTAKLLEEVRSDALRAGPVWWGKNQPGMQAAEELDDSDRRYVGYFGEVISSRARAEEFWRSAAMDAVKWAQALNEFSVHKQIVNRVLEPYSHINVVATGTDWENFFGLRLHKDAQPEMRALAEAMWRAQGDSTPTLLRRGEWHLPFIDDETQDEVVRLICSTTDSVMDIYQTLIKVSVARCGRVSYTSFETGKRSTVEEDLAMYARRLFLPEPDGPPLRGVPIHASPAEHQLTPDRKTGQQYIIGYLDDTEANPIWADGWHYGHQHGNGDRVEAI